MLFHFLSDAFYYDICNSDDMSSLVEKCIPLGICSIVGYDVDGEKIAGNSFIHFFIMTIYYYSYYLYFSSFVF